MTAARKRQPIAGPAGAERSESPSQTRPTQQMPTDTLTIELKGDVSLSEFAETIGDFSGLVEALSQARAPGAIKWEISDLEVGSATATVRGVTEKPAAVGEVATVAGDFLEVGRALQGDLTIPFDEPIRKKAAALAGNVGDGIVALRFETAEADVLLTERATRAADSPEPEAAYGAVTGRVQTLSSRSHLRFVLYDVLNDRPVSCYLDEGMEGKARDIWDKLATVEGWVSREAETGRPISVRRVSSVNVLDEGDVRGYERARAARPRRPDEPRAEERIRRLRDAG